MALAIEMNGKVALVTGAASGLGRATAVKLAEAGADLCLVDVNEAGLAETGTLLGKAEVLLHPANLADPAACAAIVPAAIARFGRLDALCNVAGFLRFANTPEMPLAEWDRTIAVNLTAPFLLCQAAIPHLLEVNGAIVNCCSSAAFIGEAYVAAYCASKAGLVHLTKCLAMEYSRRPIRINGVAPGGMMTNIGNDMKIPEGAELDLIQRFSGLRGLVEVDDVADLIVMLASPAGRSYHGNIVSIDAGITAG